MNLSFTLQVLGCCFTFAAVLVSPTPFTIIGFIAAVILTITTQARVKSDRP